MTTMLPASGRPAIGRHRVEELLHQLGVDIGKPAILGVRGYFRDTMGAVGQNDRGIYDDALVVISPNVFATFNANVDPSTVGGRLADLVPGVYRYKIGTHHPGTPNQYPCLVQAGPVTVRRDDGTQESGEFYIHIHRGGVTSTSSEGCQTVPPDQWPAFFHLAAGEMARAGVSTIPYALQEFQG